MSGNRRAVVIGIDQYRGDIPKLSGAARDATEIRDILQNYGNFTIGRGHFLTDGAATGDAIRRAISDLFWKTDVCDIALFYFSGHGIRDHLQYGYLLPVDASLARPFVKGICIQELKTLFQNSVPKTTGIIILDCCYSGIAAETDRRGIVEVDGCIDSLHEVLGEKLPGGRFILASAGANESAREEEQTHAHTKETHVHGRYTFQLLEALSLGAGPRDRFGRVSLRALTDYLAGRFAKDTQHQPKFHASDPIGPSNIFLTVIAEEQERALQEQYLKIQTALSNNSPTEWMPAIDVLNDLGKEGIATEEIDQFWLEVTRKIEESEALIFDLWLKNLNQIALNVPSNSNVFNILKTTMKNFNVTQIRNLDIPYRTLLGIILEDMINGVSAHVVAGHIKKLHVAETIKGQATLITGRAGALPQLERSN